MVSSLFIQTSFIVMATSLALLYTGKGIFIRRKLSELVHGKSGCLPVGNVGNVTLHYFAGRGRAEVIRLLLEDAQIPYSEISFSKDTWPVAKAKGIKDGLYMFGQVPALVTSSGENLVQSHTILHYIARSVGMDCECEEFTLCETLALGAEDAHSKLTKMLYSPTFNMNDRKDYLTNIMPTWFGYFEKLAPSLSNQEQAFFIGNRLTWVDFLIFDLIDTNKEFGLYNFGDDSLNVDVLSLFPRLNNFHRLFSGRNHIATYLRSKRRHPYKIPNKPHDLP